MDKHLTLAEAVRSGRIDEYVLQCEDAGAAACDNELAAVLEPEDRCAETAVHWNRCPFSARSDG